ncbi:MAG: PH domain-containing protein [Humibacillus sp.]|nr:PH domain-containing protein [Humibacillus sp.]MDN5780192.1 PH domain-containing protein [Humibacillus sp.]
MAQKQGAEQVPAGLIPVLLPGETLIIAQREHWARVAEPIITTAAVFAVAILVDWRITASTEFIATALWWCFFVTVFRLLWRLLQWRHNWFVATEKRLLLRYGLITHKVAMMPLSKVTDMTYERTIPGQLLGYGRFILESAGQDQALHIINWVPHPDVTYRAICAEIFHILPPGEGDDGEPEAGDQDDPDGDGPGAPDGPNGEGGPGGRGEKRRPSANLSPISRGPESPESLQHKAGYPDVHRVHNPVHDRLDSYSRAVPITPAEEGEPIYQSDDIRKRRRAADTGPLPLWPTD